MVSGAENKRNVKLKFPEGLGGAQIKNLPWGGGGGVDIQHVNEMVHPQNQGSSKTYFGMNNLLLSRVPVANPETKKSSSFLTAPFSKNATSL